MVAGLRLMSNRNCNTAKNRKKGGFILENNVYLFYNSISKEGKNMNFSDKKSLLLFLKSPFIKKLLYGAQGQVYLDLRNRKVYKIFHQFLDDYDEEEYSEYRKNEILKFKNYINSTFIFPYDVIKVDNVIVGNIASYVPGKNLYLINPLSVMLDPFIEAVTKANEDIKEISKNRIKTYDVLYNIMYIQSKISIIDTDDYSFSKEKIAKIENYNLYNFTSAIMLFLIDNFFDQYVKSKKQLNEMYNSKDASLLEFLILLKQCLSEEVGFQIEFLKDASQYKDKNKHKPKIIRTL